MSNETQILQYLADTYKIREIVEDFAPLNPEESGVSVSTLAPWALTSISVNTGIGEDEVKKTLEGLKSFNLKNVESGNRTMTLVETTVSLEEKTEGHKIESDLPLPIRKLMNLHVFQFVQQKYEETGKPVKIEDAIFDLKNSLFLPDDFMPEHLMGMVEGEPDFSEEEVRKSYSVLNGVTSLYFFQENKSGGFGRIRYLCPAASGRIENAPSNEKLREIISSSFSSIQTQKSYVDFVNSRLIKNVIFNLEQKNSRELKRPMFDPRKIKVLEEMGIVERDGEVSSVKNSIAVDYLKELYAKAKSAGQELAENWLSSDGNVI